MQYKLFREDFKLFRIIDMLMPGSLGPITTVIAVLVAMSAGVALSAKLLMFAVAACMWFIYGAMIYNRYQYLKKIDYITSDGVGIISNGIKLERAQLESITKNMISKWETVIKWGESTTAIYGTIIIFTNPPLELNGVKYNGYTINNVCHVAMILPDPDKTAMEHEMGHVIYNAWTNTYDNDACHAYMKAHGLR